MVKDKQAFTLIELLVVVLIIGILAAVALPQYNKAVYRARLAEVATTYKAFERSIDLYLLENGGYLLTKEDGSVDGARFTGTHKNVETGIYMPCDSEDTYICYLSQNNSGWTVFCTDRHCEIQYYNRDVSKLLISSIYWKNKQVFFVSADPDKLPLICPWLRDLNGADNLIDSVASQCAPYL